MLWVFRMCGKCVSSSDEIVYGKLDMSKFAVELNSILDGFADNANTNYFLKIHS